MNDECVVRIIVTVDANHSEPAETEQPQSTGRRKFLTIATAVVGGVGVVGASVPFIGSLGPSAKAKADAADVEVDISSMEPGQLILVRWQSKPVWIVRRTPEILAELAIAEDKLRDPNSEKQQQPSFAKNRGRSLNDEYLILVGICTHLGCSPKHLKNGAMEKHVEGVKNGFFCPCHGSKFDMAGRVFKNVPAPLNLVVPRYHFINDTTVVIGSEAEVS